VKHLLDQPSLSLLLTTAEVNLPHTSPIGG
jgi:hypothetical protein